MMKKKTIMIVVKEEIKENKETITLKEEDPLQTITEDNFTKKMNKKRLIMI